MLKAPAVNQEVKVAVRMQAPVGNAPAIAVVMVKVNRVALKPQTRAPPAHRSVVRVAVNQGTQNSAGIRIPHPTATVMLAVAMPAEIQTHR